MLREAPPWRLGSAAALGTVVTEGRRAAPAEVAGKPQPEQGPAWPSCGRISAVKWSPPRKRRNGPAHCSGTVAWPLHLRGFIVLDTSLAFTAKFPVISVPPTQLSFSPTPEACSPAHGMQGSVGTWPSWRGRQPRDCEVLSRSPNKIPAVAACRSAGRLHWGCRFSCCPPGPLEQAWR